MSSKGGIYCASEGVMMKILSLPMILLIASMTQAFAQENDDFGFPPPIDVETQRNLLSEAFPHRDESLKTIDKLIKYIRDLEIYRRQYLESYNIRNENNCKDLKKVELRVNKAFGRGDLSPNEKSMYDEKIAEERSRCLYKKGNNSEYYDLYQSFIDLYRDEVRSAKIDRDRCYSNDPCRSRAL